MRRAFGGSPSVRRAYAGGRGAVTGKARAGVGSPFISSSCPAAKPERTITFTMADQTDSLALVLTQIRTGPLVVLVGAGASMGPPAHLPSWTAFVESMIHLAQGIQPQRASLMRDELQRGDLLSASDLFVQGDRIPKSERLKMFATLFDRTKAELPSVYHLLARLPASQWLTTNFDPFLRMALNENASDVEVVSNGKDQIRGVIGLWGSKRFCVYLHGRCREYDSLVYTSAGYQQLQTRNDYRTVLEKAFFESTILAFGYSFSDPDLLKIVDYCIDDLGSNTSHTHFIFTSDARALPLRLSKANFVPIQYSSDDDHKQAKDYLRRLIEDGRRTTPSILAPQRSDELRRLSRLFISIVDPNERATVFQAASAALVLRAAETSRRLSHEDLVNAVHNLGHVNVETAREMTRRGTEFLSERGHCTNNPDGTITFGTIIPNDSTKTVVDAIEVRLRGLNSNYQSLPKTREAIQSIVTHAMLTQGMTIARSFVHQDDVKAYVLSDIVDEAILQSLPTVKAFSRELKESVSQILLDPEPEVSQSLFQLAHAAYALETVFLNPVERNWGDILKWKIYVDSNVILRMLSPYGPIASSFRSLLDRCRQLGITVASLYPFLEECAGQVRIVERELQAAKVESKVDLERHVAALQPRERSPILDWYVSDVSHGTWKTFKMFKQTRSLDSTTAIARLAKNIGVDPEEPQAIRKFDTSDRETLWADLRAWRNDQSTKGRVLRRNEATQIELLVALRDAGIRAWFLSVDGQLRRALVGLRKGHYAGFVMTPTAWAHRFSELHWGQVDFASFTSLMWSYPEQTPDERARRIVLRQLLERPEVQGVEPELLRDRLDYYFSKAQFSTAFAPIEGDNQEAAEERFQDVLAQALPVTVERIIDDIVRDRLSRV